MKFKTILRIKLNQIESKTFDRITVQGKLKFYDQIESMMTKYYIPVKSFTDLYDGKIDSKKRLIQTIMNILLWIAPIKWFIEFIIFQHYDYHEAAYYTSYYGMVYGKDEASFISLAILTIFAGNYYHSFSK